MLTSLMHWLLETDAFPLSNAWGAQLLETGTGLMLAWNHGVHKLRDGLEWRSSRRERWLFLDEVRAAGFPLPVLSAWMATAAQLGGGLCLAAGLFTRPMALLLAGTLLGAVYTTCVLKKDSQMALVYLLLVLSAALLGGGPWSVDAFLFNRP